MKFIVRSVVLLLFLIFCQNNFIYGQKIREHNFTIEEFINKKMGNNGVSMNLLVPSKNLELYERLVVELEASDKMKRRSHHIVSSMNRIAAFSKDTTGLKRRIALQFLKIAENEDYTLGHSCLDKLAYYPKKTFQDEELLLKIENILENGNPNGSIFLIAGFIGEERFIPLLKQHVKPFDKYHKAYGSDSWKANLALARMGDQESLDYVMNNLSQYGRLTLVRRFLDDLNYIKKKESLDILLEMLYSDDRYQTGMGYSAAYSFAATVSLKNSMLGLPLDHLGRSFLPSYEDINLVREHMKNPANHIFNMDNFD